MKRKYSVESSLDDMLGQQVTAGKRPSDPKLWVDRALRACLPPGVPPSYSSIDSASYVSSQPKHEAVADVTMFDGQPGRVRVWLWSRAGSWAHEWLSTGDAHCSFEGGRWIRIDPVSLEPVPDQRELFGAAS